MFQINILFFFFFPNKIPGADCVVPLIMKEETPGEIKLLGFIMALLAKWSVKKGLLKL